MAINSDKSAENLHFIDSVIRFVINNVNYPTLVNNSAEEIIYANNTYLEKANKSANEVLGQKYYSFYPKLQASIENYLTPASKYNLENVLLININYERLCHVGFSIFNHHGIHQYTLLMFGLINNEDEELIESEKIRLFTQLSLKPIFESFANTDHYSFKHKYRVANLALKIAKGMQLAEDQQQCVYITGALMDIGKYLVSSSIIDSETKLSDIEFSLIQSYPEKSFEILSTFNFALPIAKATYQHHERMDGSGYPQGIKNDQIILEARILAVADTITAMTEERPYRPAFDITTALSAIQNEKFDPAVVATCLRLLKETPEIFK